MGKLHTHTIIIRLVIALVIARAVWLLLSVPQIANIFINFCTIGLVPGTNLTLTPTVMFILMGFMSVATIGVVVYGDFSRLLTHISLAPKEVTTLSDAIAASPAPADSGFGRYLAISGAYVAYCLELLGFSTYKLGERLWVYCAAVWKWVEPYAQALDSFLEQKIREAEQSEVTVVAHDLFSEMAVVMSKWFAQAKQIVDYGFPHRGSRE